jgi:hypothetical protein
MAQLAIAARRINCQLLIAACAAVSISGESTSANQAVAQTKQRIVSVSEMTEFLKSISRRQSHEYPAVLRDAEQRFPQRTVLQGFPELVSEQLPTPTPPALNLARGQLVRDGLDPAGMKGVTIFQGDNGVILVDVIVGTTSLAWVLPFRWRY